MTKYVCPLKGLLLASCILGQMPVKAFSDMYLNPGESAEFAFTVNNTADSVGPLEDPRIVYEKKPWWFTMGGTLEYESIPPGTSREMVLEL